MTDTIFIDGAADFAVSHHDGRFLRSPGLAALARRDADGGYTVLHRERCEAINRQIGPGHPRWSWALAQGLDTLRVHPLDRPRPKLGTTSRAPVRWHVDALGYDDESPLLQ
ncbi:hypothetical protein [Phenylobacterium sp.]|jgi:hypothetical protein|uniref:hypothetical protein n=1 Tax=Phenylobacterium sp. TaxID=1871053 RepID=UPI001B52D317|nr:hypothetical protein [Phenylobacterium sp.]MBP7648236.1 hypothetical protein [Phenylobacterium sp.]MBP9753412.1 hypothetical protein [Phenylobacterium sp.]MDP1600225.1 hypothetical protein [Phenylobacterium sp.]MDP3593622.1 hypothetical protein [Phenylobacterium sp.]